MARKTLRNYKLGIIKRDDPLHENSKFHKDFRLHTVISVSFSPKALLIVANLKLCASQDFPIFAIDHLS